MARRVTGLKKWLKENGYTEEQMQAYWDELIEINSTVRALHRSGLNWDQTNLSIISQLPTEKERTLKVLEERKHKEEQEKIEREKAEAAKKYYENNFESIIINKIDSHEDLTEKEISRLVFNYDIENTYGENRRWTRSVSTIIRLGDRYFCIEWEEGLTECQTNEYFEQPYEVEEHEYEKTIIVREWRKKNE